MSGAPVPAALAPQFPSFARQHLAGRLGMWIFLTSETLFFGPLFFGYWYVRTHFPDAAGAASRHTDLLLGTVNTAVLLTSSLAVALAVLARKQERAGRMRLLLLGAVALGAVFLVIKGSEYHAEWRHHLVPSPGFAPGDAAHLLPGMALFFLLYFAMTGLHALHLLAGMGLCLWTAWRGARADAHQVELVALYWHLVDLVWVFLYPLLYLVARAGSA